MRKTKRIDWQTLMMTLSSGPALFILAFLLAFAVRMIFVLQWHNATPYGAVPLLDARAYDEWAMEITNGQWLRSQAFYQAPFYPYILAIIYKVLGHSLMAASVANAVFSAATVSVLADITRRIFGVAAAVVVIALATFYQPFIFYTAPVMKEPLGLLMLALYMAFTLQAFRDGRLRYYVAAGMMLGLAVLTRGNLLLLLPVTPLFAWLALRGKALQRICVFILSVFLTLSPATFHNAIASRDFVPVSYADGFNLYIGHFPGANGTNSYPPEISTDPVHEEYAVRHSAEEALGRTLGPSDVARYWRGQAFAFMMHNPAQEVVLLIYKLRSFWNNAQPFDNYDIGFIAARFGTLMAQPLFEFWVVAALAAFSVTFLLRGRSIEMAPRARGHGHVLMVMAGVYMVSVLIFYVTDRYRMPVVLFLLPLAGAAAPCLQYAIRYRMRQDITLGMLAMAVITFVALMPPVNRIDLTPFNIGTLTAVYADLGQDRATLDALEEGVRLAPDQIGAQAFVRGAIAEDNLGEPERARRWLELAVNLYPQDGVAWYNVGRMYAARGELAKAQEAFLKARDLAPVYTLTYYALARLYEKQGDMAAARDALAQGLRINPHDKWLNELKSLDKSL